MHRLLSDEGLSAHQVIDLLELGSVVDLVLSVNPLEYDLFRDCEDVRTGRP